MTSRYHPSLPSNSMILSWISMIIHPSELSFKLFLPLEQSLTLRQVLFFFHYTHFGAKSLPNLPPKAPYCCYLVAKLCPTLGDPMNCSTPNFLSFTISIARTHVHEVSDAISSSAAFIWVARVLPLHLWPLPHRWWFFRKQRIHLPACLPDLPSLPPPSLPPSSFLPSSFSLPPFLPPSLPLFPYQIFTFI